MSSQSYFDVPLQQLISVLVEELCAIFRALTHARQRGNSVVLIVFDSRLAYKYKGNCFAINTHIEFVYRNLTLIAIGVESLPDMSFHFFWVPSHVVIREKERANALSKLANTYSNH